jgi:uncharacterized protein YwbE
MQYMKATLIYSRKEVRPTGVIVQAVIWQLPAPSAERPHGLKYRLYCGQGGQCLVRYDNEAGKGDHRHHGEHEEPYQFMSFDQLLDDFYADVARLTGG